MTRELIKSSIIDPLVTKKVKKIKMKHVILKGMGK